MKAYRKIMKVIRNYATVRQTLMQRTVHGNHYCVVGGLMHELGIDMAGVVDPVEESTDDYPEVRSIRRKLRKAYGLQLKHLRVLEATNDRYGETQNRRKALRAQVKEWWNEQKLSRLAKRQQRVNTVTQEVTTQEQQEQGYTLSLG